MKQKVNELFDIPCFKCLFWKSERENQVYCKPSECEELTGWLLTLHEISQSKGILVLAKGKSARATWLNELQPH